MKELPIKEFKYGTIDSIEDVSIPRGALSRSLNWLSSGVKMELRRGMTLLGTTENSGVGRITGLRVAKKPDGTDIVYRTRKRKIEYLNRTTNDWVEVGTNSLPAAVVTVDSLGEDISIEPYDNATGPQVWFNSKNSGPHKIMTANPGSITDMNVSGTNYKGKMRIKSGRQWVGNRAGTPPDRTSSFASKLDTKKESDYTQIVDEVIAGASGTLAFKGGGARRICFQVVFTVTSGGEVFTDNGDGTLTGSLGTTGATINYTSGAYAGVGAGTCTYRWADDSSGGIADFNFSSTRVAGEGFILRQAGGGDWQNLASLNGVEYALHEKKTWAINISVDDTDLTNLIFRSKVGISNHRAMAETGDGIYYIDESDQNDPQLRVLTIDSQSSEVVPRSVSRQYTIADVRVGINLAGYRFDRSAGIEFGNFVIFSCRTTDSDTNNRVLIYNKDNKACQFLDYFVSCFDIYDGNLIAGDDVSDNVYILLSGTDDNQSYIGNYAEGNLDNLDYRGRKRIVEITVDGEIGPEQAIKISMSTDRGPFVEVRSKQDVTAGVHAIEDDGDYIDRTQSVNVGAFTLGRGEVGGGSDGIVAYHYRRSFRIALDKCEFVKFRVEAMRLGYASVTEFTYRDIRLKWRKIPSKYLTDR